MKALPIQKRALLKRSALIESAIVSFNNAGYEATTAKTIASGAGVAVGTFYQYFENKDDILAAIAEQRFTHIESNLQLIRLSNIVDAADKTAELDVEDTLCKAMHFIYEFHAADAELHQVLEYRKRIDPRLGNISSLGEMEIQRKVLHFVRSLNVDLPELVAENIFAMAEGVVHRHVFEHSDSDKDKAIANAAKILAAFFQQ